MVFLDKVLLNFNTLFNKFTLNLEIYTVTSTPKFVRVYVESSSEFMTH